MLALSEKAVKATVEENALAAKLIFSKNPRASGIPCARHVKSAKEASSEAGVVQ